MFETPGNYLGRFSKLFQTNSNFEFELGHAYPNLCQFSFLSFYSNASRPREGRRSAGDLSLESRDSKNPFPLSYLLGVKEEGAARGQTLPEPSLSLCSSINVTPHFL
jgi:hypothetical protein